MTEERAMISYSIIERTFDKAGDAKAQWLMIQAISEPAPPKDWRPYCFDQFEWCLGKMNPISIVCEQCPHRIIIVGDYHKNENDGKTITS